MKPGVLRAAWVVGLGLLLGALAGVVWEAWWTPPSGAALHGEWIPDTAGAPAVVGAEGTFVVVGGVLGLLYGVGVLAFARGREVVTSVSLFAGALLAARVAEAVGGWLGPADAAAAAKDAEDLTPIDLDLFLAAPRSAWWPEWLGSTALLVPAFVVTGLVVVVYIAGWGPRQRRKDALLDLRS